MITEISLRVSPKTANDSVLLEKELAKKLQIPSEEINAFRITRRSIDARQKKVMINLKVSVAYGADSKLNLQLLPKEFKPLSKDAGQIIIVGAGPAGLFAALRAIEKGYRPIVLERGECVENRIKALAKISRDGVIDPDTNYCFGEGGAGAYSDGKLFTRSTKRGNVEEVLQLLVQHGASENILIDAHPHIGSDKLPEVIRNIRQTIIKCGGMVKFNTKVVALLIDGKSVVGVKTASGEEYMGPVVLATGHSARDIYRMLAKQNVKIEAKGLAIGVRLEHPQHLIDSLQYHSKEGRGKYLPAAEYSFVTQVNGRGVYSFCMCPGGVIVPSMSGPDQSVVNGMSASARASQWANSGMVVELHPGDISGYSQYGDLEMLHMQEALEKAFYEASGKTVKAPAQVMTDFVKGKASGQLPRSSYPAGVIPARLDQLLPSPISDRLKEGFKHFDKKCPGFLTDKALMVGLESRTSSPVRIPRDKISLSHIDFENLYPAGEGAGFAGGIVSAAIDGQRCIDAYDKIYKDKANGNNT